MTLLQQQRERLFFKHREQETANTPDCQFLSNPPFECETKTSFVHRFTDSLLQWRLSFFRVPLMCCPPDGRPSTHQGGMAVAAAWVPVCAEDLTWRQLPLLFWTNIRISTAIAANINHLHRKYKRFWTIWVFIFTGKLAEIVGPRGDTRFSAELTYIG